MKVLERYFVSEIICSVTFVLITFVSIFTFLELMTQLELIGKNNYLLEQVLLYVITNVPHNIYELMPIAVLIGTIYTLAQLAAHSEFIIMRVSSVSYLYITLILVKIGLIFFIFTILISELIIPKTKKFGEILNIQAQHTSTSQYFQSGFWIKDTLNKKKFKNTVICTRILNIQHIINNKHISGIKIYELDKDFRLINIIFSDFGEYIGNNIWKLSQVQNVTFTSYNKVKKNTSLVLNTIIQTQAFLSEVTPEILSVLLINPDYMSILNLYIYIKYLKENNQHVERYEIAFWKKIIYPLSIFVMMILALPFAYLHFRVGNVSLKISFGIIIGVCFQLSSNLFSHIGLLNSWPAYISVFLPNILFISIALIILYWIRRY